MADAGWQHEEWAAALKCPLLRLDGGLEPEYNAERIVRALEELKASIGWSDESGKNA